MNKKIEDILEKIWDDPSDTIPNDLLRDLTDTLCESEFYVPVRDDEIVLMSWGIKKFIPISCNLDDFTKAFSDETPEVFEFKHLKEFITPEVSGMMINPGGRLFSLNRYLSELAFNKDRPKQKVTGGYDVKVRLNDFRPLTWRDLIIPENMTFMELDDVLKTLWGFNGHHLSCFLLPDRLKVMDDELAKETMMDSDYDANTTAVGEIFKDYKKVTYWYDFGDDWRFDIEIKKKIDYDKDYVTIKRFKGKYNPIEDCRGIYGLSEVVFCAENPGKGDEYFEDFVDYLEEFDMEFSQMALERKAYVKSNWHRHVD